MVEVGRTCNILEGDEKSTLNFSQKKLERPEFRWEENIKEIGFESVWTVFIWPRTESSGRTL
jgi:hypothetical protein